MRLSKRGLIVAGLWLAGKAGADDPVQGGINLEDIGTRVGASSTTSSSRPKPTDLLNIKWILGTIKLGENSVIKYNIIREEVEEQNIGSELKLLLCQTMAEDGDAVRTDNTRSIIPLLNCSRGQCNDGFAAFERGSTEFAQSVWNFVPNGPIDQPMNNFFLCFGQGEDTENFYCQAYSEFFSIHQANTDGKPVSSSPAEPTNGKGRDDLQDKQGPTTTATRIPLQTPTSVLSIASNWPFISYTGAPFVAAPTPQPTSTKGTTISSTTPMATGQTVASPGTSSRKKGGLSVGAIVGIVLGVLVILSLLAALALFFCIRRRRRAQSGAQKHEQVMLTHAHGDNNSQDLLSEKDLTVHTLIHPNSNDSNFSRRDRNPTDSGLRQTLIPASGGHDRHDSTGNALGTGGYRDADETHEIHLSSYDHPQENTSPPTQPFVAPTSSSPPRRKPTNASMAPSVVSALSRNVSTSTTASRPRSPSIEYTPPTHLQDIGEEPTSTSRSSAQLEGQARYGETRHTPTFHTGPSEGVRIVPTGGSGNASGNGGFYSEPGMSAEEVARLEEEERRIDAAIAEADNLRERERGLR